MEKEAPWQIGKGGRTYLSTYCASGVQAYSEQIDDSRRTSWESGGSGEIAETALF